MYESNSFFLVVVARRATRFYFVAQCYNRIRLSLIILCAENGMELRSGDRQATESQVRAGKRSFRGDRDSEDRNGHRI